MQIQWIFLAVAIVSEVIATSALKTSEGFTLAMPDPVTHADSVAHSKILNLLDQASSLPTELRRRWNPCQIVDFELVLIVSFQISCTSHGERLRDAPILSPHAGFVSWARTGVSSVS